MSDPYLSFAGYGNLFNYPSAGDSVEMVLDVTDKMSVLLEIREGPNMPAGGTLSWTSEPGGVTGSHTFCGLAKENKYDITLPVGTTKLKFKITGYKMGADGSGASFGNTTSTNRFMPIPTPPPVEPPKPPEVIPLVDPSTEVNPLDGTKIDTLGVTAT